MNIKKEMKVLILNGDLEMVTNGVMENGALHILLIIILLVNRIKRSLSI
jgi:hypothetical protein